MEKRGVIESGVTPEVGDVAFTVLPVECYKHCSDRHCECRDCNPQKTASVEVAEVRRLEEDDVVGRLSNGVADDSQS